MKKRVYSLLLALVFCLMLAVPAFAADNAAVVSDELDLLTEKEERVLSDYLASAADATGMTVAVHTVDYAQTSGDMAYYAEECYDAMFGSADGILLVIAPTEDWENVYYQYSTSGEAIRLFNDDALDRLDDAVIPAPRDRDFNQAALLFAKTCAEIGEDAGPNYVMWVIIALVAGAVLSFLIPMSILKGQLKSVRSATAAANYVRPGSMNLTQQRDIFLYRRVTRTAKPKNNSGSSGGSGSHGGRGGKV